MWSGKFSYRVLHSGPCTEEVRKQPFSFLMKFSFIKGKSSLKNDQDMQYAISQYYFRGTYKKKNIILEMGRKYADCI